MKKTVLTILVSLFCLASATADERKSITSGWQFVRQDMATVWEVVRPVKAGKPESVPLWTNVTIPHCWNASDAVDPDVNYYQGAGWYRNTINISNPYLNGRTFLEFEGAGQKTDVYVYTTKVGSHVGGYDKWTVDITDAVKAYGKTEVPVIIRCDNTRDTEMIPSDMSDFNLYGGLYRKVNLVYKPQSWLENIQIDTQDNKVKIEAAVRGIASDNSLLIQIITPAGKQIAEKRISIDASKDGVHSEFEIKRPMRWDVDNPQRYTCILTLEGKDGVSTYAERFGFRTFEFKKHGPFFLNGRRLLLQGTHRHEDHAGVGAAMTDEQIREELKQIKDMGANFIRLGHYQQADLVLELCDSLGLLVWEETPWCRGGLGGEKYKEQARRMLTNMIQQHRNHPSIILWSLGNENDWPGDFETFDKDSIHAFMSELNDLSHKLDPSRKTAIRRCDFCSDVVDVYSPSIWAGWYSSTMADYNKMENDAINKFDHFFHAEWGGDSHARRHAEQPYGAKVAGDWTTVERGDGKGDWSESYIVRLFDWHLKEQLNMPNLTGAAFWTFKDFSTPLRPTNPIPYVNQKGVVERDGTPKESYYVFQSYWAKAPMVHIYGHSWPVRWGDANEEKEILVYSNCAEVELFVNGVSYGKKKRNPQDFPAAGFHWNVPLREGSNNIKAVAGKLTDEITQEYQTAKWGAPAAVKAETETMADGSIMVKAQLVDKNGIRCLDSRNWIEFGIAGDGTLCDNQGTSTGSRKIQAANGAARIKIKNNGTSIVAVKSEGAETAFVTIK